MVGSGKVEMMITSKGCSKVFSDVSCKLGTDSFRDHLQPPRHSMAASASLLLLHNSTSNSPFSGLVICVTGLSKEARKQVMDATEKLGGEYSPHLNPHCTHLVLQNQSSYERKSSYALKHGSRLFIVTLGWFVDSVRRNVRLNESLYVVKSFGENHMANNDLNRVSFGNSCRPIAMLENAKQSNVIRRSILHSSEDEKRKGFSFSGQTVYIDSDISAELRNKIVEAVHEEGALLANRWSVGHDATHVVCEGSSVRKYIGHSNNLVTPLWVLKTAKEIRSQRLVHLSADLARHVGIMLGDMPGGIDLKDSNRVDEPKSSLEEKQKIVILAKKGVRNRRVQAYQTPIKPLARNVLLDSINWSISEPSTTASICMDSFSFDDSKTSEFVKTNESTKEPEACFVNFLHPLSEREKNELVFGNHFITILFPMDRFLEMGPCSRTFFNDTGFTCSQLLHHIYTFYQENLSTSEIELAIHTDSRHADRLRSLYSSNEAAKCGFVELKRIDFLGSRKSFEMLKRVPGDNNNNVYELLTRP